MMATDFDFQIEEANLMPLSSDHKNQRVAFGSLGQRGQ